MILSVATYSCLSMRKASATLMILATFVLMPMVAMSAKAEKKHYIVVVNEAPPFRIIDEWDGKTGYSGAYIDIINELSLRTDIPLTFLKVPFARALSMMKDGSADMMLGPNWSVERAEFMVYLDAAFPAETKVFYLGHHVPDITRYSDLKNKTIGALRKGRYFDRFDEDEDLDKVLVDSYEHAFRMLEADRLEAFIIPERQGAYLKRRLDYDFRTATFRIPGKVSFITVSRKSSLNEHRDKIEKAMSELNTEGYFERLIQLYVR